MLMTKREIYEAWAPTKAIWSPWVKPVLFSQMEFDAQDEALALPSINMNWGCDSEGATALVVDLPGEKGVQLGVSLARDGFRPVPLYNACPQPPGEIALVDVPPIIRALAAGATSLLEIGLPASAAPAFLLDSNRNPPSAPLAPGVFDNRSISLPTDFPSANRLLSHGIRRVVLIQAANTTPPADLSHTLCRWQEAGLIILAASTTEPNAIHPITVRRPRAFHLLWYNFLAKLGFKLSPLGGFGGQLPMPSSG